MPDLLHEGIIEEARAMHLLTSGKHWPSESWTLPAYMILATCSIGLPSTVMSVDGNPALTFCSFVFGQDMCKHRVVGGLTEGR